MADDESFLEFHELNSATISKFIKLQASVRGFITRRMLEDIRKEYEDIVSDIDRESEVCWPKGLVVGTPVVRKKRPKGRRGGGVAGARQQQQRENDRDLVEVGYSLKSKKETVRETGQNDVINSGCGLNILHPYSDSESNELQVFQERSERGEKKNFGEIDKLPSINHHGCVFDQFSNNDDDDENKRRTGFEQMDENSESEMYNLNSNGPGIEHKQCNREQNNDGDGNDLLVERNHFSKDQIADGVKTDKFVSVSDQRVQANLRSDLVSDGDAETGCVSVGAMISKQIQTDQSTEGVVIVKNRNGSCRSRNSSLSGVSDKCCGVEEQKVGGVSVGVGVGVDCDTRTQVPYCVGSGNLGDNGKGGNINDFVIESFGNSHQSTKHSPTVNSELTQKSTGNSPSSLESIHSGAEDCRVIVQDVCANAVLPDVAVEDDSCLSPGVSLPDVDGKVPGIRKGDEELNDSHPVQLCDLPEDRGGLLDLKSSLTMELLWVQQAINSRKHYLRLKQQMVA